MPHRNAIVSLQFCHHDAPHVHPHTYVTLPASPEMCSGKHVKVAGAYPGESRPEDAVWKNVLCILWKSR